MASDKSRRPQRDLEDRLALLEALGGLVPEFIQVSNQEWLYMLLEEETRHSLAIEGTREHPPVRPHPLPPGRPDWRERVWAFQESLFRP